MSRSAFLVFLLFVMQSCRDSDPGPVYLLTDEQVALFPKDYYNLDTLKMVYSDSLTQDTFILQGSKLEQYVLTDGHMDADPTRHETWKKRFQNQDGSQFLQLEMTTMQDDEIVAYGGILFTVPKARLPVSFGAFEDVDTAQVVRPIPYEYTYKDTIIYNRISGVKTIKVNRPGGLFRLDFYR